MTYWRTSSLGRLPFARGRVVPPQHRSVGPDCCPRLPRRAKCRVRRDGLRACYLRRRPAPTRVIGEHDLGAARGPLGVVTRNAAQDLHVSRLEVSVGEDDAAHALLLQRLDHVAYIRFASVYLSFEDIQAFEEVIQTLSAEPTPELQRRQVPLIDEDR